MVWEGQGGDPVPIWIPKITCGLACPSPGLVTPSSNKCPYVPAGTMPPTPSPGVPRFPSACTMQPDYLLEHCPACLGHGPRYQAAAGQAGPWNSCQGRPGLPGDWAVSHRARPWAAIWHCHLTPPGTSLSSWQHDRRDVALGTSAALNIEAKGNVSPTVPVLRAPGITQAEAHSPGTSHIGDRGGAPPALPGQPQPPAGP